MKKTLLAIGGAVMALLLVACGSDSGLTNPTTTSDSSAPTQNTGMQALLAAGDSIAEAKTVTLIIEMEVLGQPSTTEAKMRYESSNVALSSVSNDSSGQSESRLVDGVLYLKLPDQERAPMGITTPWVRIPADEKSGLGQLLRNTPDDPKATLEQIQKAGTITKTEQTQLNGQPATYYLAEIEFNKLAEQPPAGLPKELFDQFKDKNLKYPMEIWIDQNQLPMQIVFDMTNVLEAMGLSAGGGGKTTIKYQDWGAPVTVEAPPANEVSEFETPTLPTPN